MAAIKQTGTAAPAPDSLEDYLALPYRLEIIGDGEGTFLVRYPELPGCFTQIDNLADAGAMAREILTGWLTIAVEDGASIPLPESERFGGRVLVRMPKSLHRWLVETARLEQVSLNAQIVSMLVAGRAEHGIQRRLDEISAKVDRLLHQEPERPSGAIRSVS